MSYERLATCRPDIRGIYTADYLITKNGVLLKANKTKLIGIYPTLSAARETLNGLLTLNGSNKPYDMSFRIKETIVDTVSYTVQNSQTGNNVNTMFSQSATNGIVDTTNPQYIEISTDLAGTNNSRARVINENETFGTLAADVWTSYSYKTSIYKATAEVANFDFSLWNSNALILGFHGNHSAGTSPTTYNCEKGCIFTPNSFGNWRCRWFSTTDSVTKPFNEVLFKDTNYPVQSKTNLEIRIEDFGKTAIWLINNSVVFSCSYTDSPQFIMDDGVQKVIKNLIYSAPTDSGEIPGEPPSFGFAAYVGAEVRRRTAGSSQYKLRLFNQSLETE
jgi:hypothetical protein